MKLDIALLTFLAAFVPQILAQMDTRMLLSLMSPDIKLPPRPPKSVFPHLYQSPAQRRAALLRDRREQEMRIFRHLKAMTPEQVRAFQDKLSPQQLNQLVQRLKYLKHADTQQQPPKDAGVGGPNMVLSGANTVRRLSPAARAALAARRRQSSRRPTNPMDAIRKMQSFRKKASGAIAAGCRYPMGMEGMDTFVAFSAAGGCRGGGMAMCAMSGMSCVDVGSSIMCCPPGYTAGTIDMMSYMRQMNQFMAQFS